jgi:hypothetical protein
MDDWLKRSPYSLALDTPDKKAWAAAEAFTEYIGDDLGYIDVSHQPFDTLDGQLVDPAFRTLPDAGIIVLIGTRNSLEIQLDLEQRGLRIEERQRWGG